MNKQFFSVFAFVRSNSRYTYPNPNYTNFEIVDSLEYTNRKCTIVLHLKLGQKIAYICTEYIYMSDEETHLNYLSTNQLSNTYAPIRCLLYDFVQSEEFFHGFINLNLSVGGYKGQSGTGPVQILCRADARYVQREVQRDPAKPVQGHARRYSLTVQRSGVSFLL